MFPNVRCLMHEVKQRVRTLNELQTRIHVHKVRHQQLKKLNTPDSVLDMEIDIIKSLIAEFDLRRNRIQKWFKTSVNI